MTRHREQQAPGVRLRFALSALLIGTATSASHAQTMDYNLNMAKRTLNEVSAGLERVNLDDVNGFNRLSTKLNKAASLLEGSESKEHPDYAVAIQQWGALQAQMEPIAAALQAAIDEQQQASAQEQQQQSAATKLPVATPTVEAVDLDPLMEKYQRQSHPALVESPTPDQARSWSVHMHALQTTRSRRMSGSFPA